MIAAGIDFTSPGFDQAARHYDQVFEENRVTQQIRPVVWKTLLTHFRTGDHVLDLSCGTGTDDIVLAKRGIRVTAIDKSSGMIQQAREKVGALNLVDYVTLHNMPMEMVDSYFGQAFDGVFSNFGGLNCIDDLPGMMRRISLCLKPDGVFIGCLLNKYSVWEIGSFILRGRLRSAFRRWKRGGTTAIIDGLGVHVRYYSARQLAAIMMRWFIVQEVYGLSIISPSPNSRRFVERHPLMTRKLVAIDERIRYSFPFNGLGDHVVVAGRRRSA